MYKRIREMKTPPKQYQDQLIAEGVISAEEAEKLRTQIEAHFEQEFQKSLNFKPQLKDTTNPAYRGSRSMTHKWEGMQFSQWGEEPKDTGIETSKVLDISRATVDLPADFNVHPRLKKMFIDARLKTIEKKNVDWAMAESSAFGSLITDGYNVRIVGEDSERGTFSQRHAVFTDQVTSKPFTPLRQSPYMQANQVGRMQVFNTNLSELGTMAYEYGYSLENPKNLVIWEAQFGDFYNPAQLVID